MRRLGTTRASGSIKAMSDPVVDVTETRTAPVVDVVVVSWNVRAELLACLESVLASTGVDARPIVVDNASADGSADAVAKAHAELRLIRNPDNRGFARAANQGIAAGHAPWVLLLNPDTVVPPDAIAKLVAHLDELPEHAMVVPRLVDAAGRMEQSAYLFPSIPIALMVAVGAHHLLPRSRRQQLLFPGHWGATAQDVPWAIGAVMLIRRSAIERVGALDESFFVYVEDMEWCRRIRSEGMRIRFIPEVSVIHHGNRSGAQHFGDERTREYLANTLHYLRREKGRLWAWSFFGINTASAVGHAMLTAVTARVLPSARRVGVHAYWRDQARGHLAVVRARRRLDSSAGRRTAGL
jgi:N-acetylglucosaminyl-diphospho-decaprenol L-rhamnosyltransferase